MAHTPKEMKTSPQMSAAIADRVTSPRDTTQSFGRIGIPALAAAAEIERSCGAQVGALGAVVALTGARAIESDEARRLVGPYIEALDRLKELGFREATRAGVSIGIDDMIIPHAKKEEIDTALKQDDRSVF